MGEITLGSGRRAAGIRHVRGGVAAEERTQLVVVGDRGQRSEIEIIVDLDQSIDHPFAEGALHVGYERHVGIVRIQGRSDEHTSELQSLMRLSYAVFSLKKLYN